MLEDEYTVTPLNSEDTQEETGYTVEVISPETSVTDPIDPRPSRAPLVTRHLRESQDLDKAMEVTGNDLAYSLQVTKGLDPSTARRIAKVAKESKLPRGTIQRNLPQTEQNLKDKNILARLNEVNKDGSFKYPKTAEFLKTPKHMAQARNEVDRLAEIERIVKHEEGRDSEWFKTSVGKSLAKGSLHAGSSLASAPGHLQDLRKYSLKNMVANNPLLPESLRTFAEMYQIEPSKDLIENQFSNYLEEEADKIIVPETQENAIDQIFSDGEILKGTYNIFLQAAESAPLMLGMAGMTMAGVNPAITLGAMGEIEAAGSYKEGLRRGKSPDQAMTAANIKGVAEAGFEIVTLGAMSRILRKQGAKLVERFGKETAKQIVARSAKNLGKGFAEEGLAEGATTVVQDWADYITGDKDALDGVGKRALNSFLVGGMTGGGMSFMQSAQETQLQAKLHEDKARQDKEIAESLEKDKVEDPEFMTAALNNTFEGEEIAISPERLEEESYNQSKHKDAEGLVDQEAANKELEVTLKDLGIYDKVMEARATGKDVRINRAQWLVKYANTDLGKALENDIKYGDNGLSAKELETAKKDVVSSLKEVEREVKDALKSQQVNPRIEAMRDSLIEDFGLKAEDADAKLKVFLAGGAVLAKKQGETLDQWIDRINPVLEVGGRRRLSDELQEVSEPLKMEDLPDDVRAEAEEFVDSEIQRMMDEVTRAEVSTGLVETDAGEKTRFYDNSFPKWYRDMKVQNKEAFNKAIEKKKGKVYERIRAKALEHLIHGVESAQERIDPDQDFRDILGYEDETFEQRDDAGIRIKKGEQSLYTQYPYSEVDRIGLQESDEVKAKDSEGKVDEVLNNILKDVKGETYKNEVTGQEVRFTEDSLTNFVSLAGRRLESKKKKRASNKFRASMTALLNRENLFKNAKPISINSQGVVRYNAIGRTADTQVFVDFKVNSKGDIVSFDVISMKLKKSDTLPEAPLQGGVFDPGQISDKVSIEHFAQGVNVGIESDQTFFQDQVINKLNQDTLGFYSKLAQEVGKMDFKTAPAKDVLSRIKKLEGVKKEEIEWTGLDSYLEAKAAEGVKVSKQELTEYLEANGPKLEEVVLGETGLEEDGEEPTIYGEDGAFYNILQDRDGETIFNHGPFETEQEAVEDGNDSISAMKLTESRTKYGSYTLPGGENYREILVRMPSKTEGQSKLITAINNRLDEIEGYYDHVSEEEQDAYDIELEHLKNKRAKESGEVREEPKFRSSHFDESNILTHFRLKDRVDSEGKKVLFIEEIQSDWHQAGRKKGYKGEDLQEELDRAIKMEHSTLAELEKVKGSNKYQEGIQPLREAANEAYKQRNKAEEEYYRRNPNSSEKHQEEIFTRYKEAISNYTRLNEAQLNFVSDMTQELRSKHEAAVDEVRRLEERQHGLVPDAPFKQTEAWTMLAFKRILRMAAEQGYDSVSWTPGEVQAERFDLSKQIEDIWYNPVEKHLIVNDLRGNSVIDKTGVTESEIEDNIGKDLTKKLLEADLDKYSGHYLKGEGLKVGGEGMKAFYDKMLTKAVEKYVKKLDKSAKVGVGKVVTKEIPLVGGGVSLVQAAKAMAMGEGHIWRDMPPSLQDTYMTKAENKISGVETQEAWTLPITDKLRDKVTAGQPLFQSEGDGPRASVTFKESETLIQLFKTANKSSFLHETGHIFLKEMQRIVESGQADAQTVADLNSLRAFADGKFDVDGIEKVVRGFEKYLMEGKAPSVELQSAFNKFKQWLMAIYESIKGNNLPDINDEVRGVFDRMLATEEQITEANEYYSKKQSILELVDVPKEVKKAIDDQKEKANQTAKEKLLSKYLKAFIKAEGGRKGLTDVAREEIEAMPVHQVIEEAKELKLNEDEVIALGGEASLNAIKIKHPGLVSKKGEASLSELAMEYEYGSPEALVTDLTATEKKSQAIKELTDDYIAQKEQEILADLSDRQVIEGTEEVHNDQRLATMIAEYQILLDSLPKDSKVKPHVIEQRIYRDVARETLYEKSVAQASRYDLHAKTEKKYMKLAYKYAGEGKVEKAAEAMHKQILNHIMVQESVKIRDAKLKAEKFYKSKNMKGKLKNVEHGYMLNVQSLIAQYKLNPSLGPAEDVPSLQSVDEGLYDQLPEWIFTGYSPSGKNHYREITFREFEALDGSIRSILHAGKGALLSMEGTDLATVQQAVDESLVDMKELDDATILKRSKKITRMIKDSKIGRMYSEWIMLEYVYEELDNFKRHRTGEFGTMMKFQNRARELEGDTKQLISNTMGLAEEHLIVLKEVKERLEEELGSGFFQLPGLPVPEILQLEGVDTWTAESMVAFMLNTGNEHNYEVLKNAYKFIDKDIQKMASYFTVRELLAVQGIWDVTDTLYKPLNDTNFRMYNRNLPKVEAKAIVFQAKDGVVELPGGYYPLSFDRSISDIAEKHQEEDLMKDRNKSVLRSGKPKDGATKDRVGNAHSLPPKLSLSVWTVHIKDTVRFITHAEFLRDMNRVTVNPEWKETARLKIGKELYTRIRDNLKFQARPERRIESGFDSFLSWSRSMSTGVILGVNFGVGLKQRLSGLSAQVELEGDWLWQAFKDSDIKGSILGMDKSKLWQEVISKSKYLRAREGSMDREIHDLVSNMDPFVKRFKLDIFKDGIFKDGITAKDARDAMFFLIQANDRAMTGLVWKAAYMKEMSRNSMLEHAEADAKAIKFADAIVTQTQPSSLPLDLNAMQRSEGAMRLFTMFMTWTFKQGNRYVHKARAYRAGAITRKQYIKHLVYEGLFASWGGIVISSLLSEGDLPEWWEFGVSPLEYGVASVPLVRDIPRGIKFRQPIGQISGLEVPNRLVTAGVSTYDLITDDKDFMDFLWDVGRAGEALTGVPALTASKKMKDGYLLMTGQKKKKKRK